MQQDFLNQRTGALPLVLTRQDFGVQWLETVGKMPAGTRQIYWLHKGCMTLHLEVQALQPESVEGERCLERAPTREIQAKNPRQEQREHKKGCESAANLQGMLAKLMIRFCRGCSPEVLKARLLFLVSHFLALVVLHCLFALKDQQSANCLFMPFVWLQHTFETWRI